MVAEYNSRPDPILYMPLPDGQADVWLRKNITQEERETENGAETIWTADEVYFRTSLAEDEIAENFEAIFSNGGPVVDEMTGEEVANGITTLDRIDALESGVADLAELLAEVIG